MASLADAGAFIDAAVAIKEPCGVVCRRLGRRRRQGALAGGAPRAGVGRVGWRQRILVLLGKDDCPNVCLVFTLQIRNIDRRQLLFHRRDAR